MTSTDKRISHCQTSPAKSLRKDLVKHLIQFDMVSGPQNPKFSFVMYSNIQTHNPLTGRGDPDLDRDIDRGLHFAITINSYHD